jgi:hypothetical protein
VPYVRRPLMNVGRDIAAFVRKIISQRHMGTASDVENDGAGRDEASGLRRSSPPVVGVGLSITPIVPRSNSNHVDRC